MLLPERNQGRPMAESKGVRNHLVVLTFGKKLDRNGSLKTKC